jgi:hypothetical protein
MTKERLSSNKPVVRAQWIMTSLRQIIDPSNKRTIIWDAPVGKYIRGGKPAVRAFHNVLNLSPEFSGYGLDLTPGDMHGVKLIKDIGVILIQWFKRKGLRHQRLTARFASNHRFAIEWGFCHVQILGDCNFRHSIHDDGVAGRRGDVRIVWRRRGGHDSGAEEDRPQS